MNPRTLWACQDVASIISASVVPLARCSNASTALVLVRSRTPSDFAFVAFLGGLAAFLAGVVSLADLGLAGATWRACLAALAFVGAFCFWVSVPGAACSIHSPPSGSKAHSVS